MSVNYAERVRAEIRNYESVLAEGGVTHSIPPIFTYWACKHLVPRVMNVFGSGDTQGIFANEILRYAKTNNKSSIKVLSLGSGDCDFETSIHKIISAQLEANWSCTDLNPSVSSAAQKRVSSMGYGSRFSFHVLDLNERFVDGTFDIVMVNHSLHHFLGLEHIFLSTKKALVPDGKFLVSDMIGRNGHMRWPEAIGFVESLWQFLPERYHYNNHAKCIQQEYINYDCTSNGDFEGVRAQDILPLLLKHFHFEKFVGFGNIIDIFIDRAYGHNFSTEREFDTSFIDYVDCLNTELIDRGVVKPTLGIGTLALKPTECTYDRWSPQFSLRRPV